MHRKIKREFLLDYGLQQTEFDTVMSIDTTPANQPMEQQGLLNITCLKCGQKCHWRKDWTNSAGTSPALDQNIFVQSFSLPITVTMTVTDSDAVP